MTISKRIEQHMANASWIRRMFEEGARLRREHGDAVVDLSLGNPKIEPPESFRVALREAVADERRGLHRYMPNAGFRETRAAVAAELSKDAPVTLRGQDVIMVTGAAAGLNVFFRSTLDPGSEVIILAPYFPEYLFYIDNHGGVPVVANTRPDFTLDLDAIADAITDKTRAIVINSPNNPTGVTYTENELRGLAELLNYKNPEIYLVSDEPYRRLCHPGVEYADILGIHPRAIIVGSHSKDLALPGERIGYVAVSSEIDEVERDRLVSAMTFANRTLGFVNAPALMQRVVAKLQGQTVDPALYKQRCDLLCDGLREAGYEFVEPTGAFYLFLKTPIDDDVAFVQELAQELVLTVPGSGFGTPGYIRISYCVDLDDIARALPAFARVAARHGLNAAATS